ncbi:HAMP domain-containing sensor histidine kinase [Adhaeribacter aquaticus]|uniref:HAMP domain-containing sensor histidine kinase n=1 Tax=Adhaeribacter aquaticus TaxID=299567 RepID=UPI0003FC6561|nr:ATP-binding protein [Adhaeribacter aquaticus]
MKIRTRLTLQFTSIFAIILVLFSLIVYFFYSYSDSSAFYDSLVNRANVVAHVYLDADKVSKESYRRLLRKYYQTLPHEIVQVYNWEGKNVFREGEGSIAIKPELLESVRREGKILLRENKRQLAGIIFNDEKGKFIVIASSIDELTQKELKDLRLILGVGFLLSMVVVVGSGWAFSKQALRPILKVVDEVEQISASDLHLRLSQADGADELSHLAQTFNRMLDRLESAFDMQNTFISNASHELRTPLTAMIGELEVALMKPREITEYQHVLYSILDEARMLTRLSNGMLQIAHASFDISKIKLTPIRFDELVYQAGSEAQKRNPKFKIDIYFDQLPEDERKIMVKGNESLLLIALLNVFENACKFSDGKPVAGIIKVDHQRILLIVKDQGVGITPSDLKKVFVPFFRADNVRDTSGHGIGLPLAEKIMKLHRGTIQISSQIAVGTEVTISLYNLSEILIKF